MNETIASLLRSPKTTILLLVVGVALLGYIIWGGINLQHNIVTNQAYTQATKEFDRRNPIMSHIPYKTPFFSISYDKNDDGTLMIKIYTPSPYYRSQALQYLLRYDQQATIKYPITFIDYRSPLDTSGGKHAE